MNQRIVDFHNLVSANHTAITTAGDEAWRLVKSKGEVARLRAFLKGRQKGLHYLNAQLPPIFIADGYELKFAAILVHAKPIVAPLANFKRGTLKTGLGRNPELGDLNLVFLYLDRTKQVRMARSVLYQAKCKRTSSNRAISPKHQIFLYDSAEGFRYTSGRFAGQDRQFPIAGDRKKALQYLFVSEDPVHCSLIPSHQPAFLRWSESLFKLLLGADGKDLPSGTARGSSWSKINQDLVDIFVADSRLKSANLADLASWFNDFRNPNHWYAEAGNESIGVHTLLAVVHDQKLPPTEPDAGKVLRPPKVSKKKRRHE